MKHIAFVTMAPMDRGPSLSRHVKAAVEAIKGTGLRCEVSSMGTTIEADSLDEIFEAVKRAHASVREAGTDRISLLLKVDSRYDRPMSISSKLDSIGEGRKS